MGDLYQVILVANNVGRLTKFYRDALGFAVTYPESSQDLAKEAWVTLGSGSCQLAIHGGGEVRTSPRHVIVEGIEVRTAALPFCPIPATAKSRAVAALVAHGFEASDRLLASCVEGWVDVDQVDRGIGNFTKKIEVVGEIYRVIFHDRF